LLEMSDYYALSALLKEAGLKHNPINNLTNACEPSVATVHGAKRFLLVGTHAHQTTGYSKVTHHIVDELAKHSDIQVFHFGFQKFMAAPPDYRPYPSNVDVVDPVAVEKAGAAPQEMGFGFSQLPAYVRKVKPDVVMIYNDAGIICRFLDKLKEELKPEERTYKLIIYLDQVYTIQRPEFLARMDADAHAYIAFTDYWKSVLERQGVKKPVSVLRHGFDPAQFKVMDRATARKKHNVPDNLFIFLNLNRNTPRKRYDIVVTAFAELVARHPTKPLGLMCVCDGGESGGFPIQEIFLRELDKRKVPLQYHAHKLMISKQALTYTDEMINELYAMADVGITAADGEGFGLCQFEGMGVGIPQVVPDIGGFKDFCRNGTNAITVPPKFTSYLPLAASGIGGQIEVIDPIDLAIAAEKYLLDSDLRKAHGVAARNTVLSYKWSDEMEKLHKLIISL
jgi:glycosyltransferase involved in cell wall biosynthesis